MAATASQGSRRFVVAGIGFLLAWQVAAFAGAPRHVGVLLGLHGFVLHTLFGKAYSLVPSYFDRQLAFPRAPTAQLPLTGLGVVALAAEAWDLLPAWTDAVGAALYALGVAVFVGALGWTVRDNLTGAETGTGEANADRGRVDRLANAFVPVALAYLCVGAYATLAGPFDLPTPVAYPPAISHLLAAGAVALSLFALGFRLLPRFLVAHPPWPLVPLVLGTGAVGPLLLALGLPAGLLLQAGAVLEATAVVGFALAFAATFLRSDRRRVGFWGVLAATWFGVAGVALGLMFAFFAPTAGLVRAHLRVNLLGFLGLAIVGVSYQFYPPAVGQRWFVGDRTAYAAMAAIALGVLVELGGRAVSLPVLVTAGQLSALGGAGAHAAIVLGLFAERYW